MNSKTRDGFDRLLEDILKTLPKQVRELLDQVALIVEDEPSPEILRSMGLKDQIGEESDLCGLHWGVPLDQRSTADTLLDADRIYLFRGPILRLSDQDQAELREQIRITLLHEIGHHFGFDEDALEELGYG